MYALMSYASPDDIMSEIKDMVSMYRESYPISLGPNENRLTNRRIQDKYMSGTFITAEYVPQKNPSAEYIFTLTVGSILNNFGSGTRSSRTSRLLKSFPKSYVEISKDDADSLGINSGDRVKMTSPWGEIVAKARITDTVKRGMLFMPMLFPNSLVTTLFDYVLDPQSKTPALKTCAVKLERIGNHGEIKTGTNS